MSYTPLTNSDIVKNEVLSTDTTIFTSARMTLWIQDAADYVQEKGIQDEKAERYYCAYLISLKLKHQYVTSENGVSFSNIDPDVFYKMYQDRVKTINSFGLQKANSLLDDNPSLNPDYD